MNILLGAIGTDSRVGGESQLRYLGYIGRVAERLEKSLGEHSTRCYDLMYEYK